MGLDSSWITSGGLVWDDQNLALLGVQLTPGSATWTITIDPSRLPTLPPAGSPSALPAPARRLPLRHSRASHAGARRGEHLHHLDAATQHALCRLHRRAGRRAGRT